MQNNIPSWLDNFLIMPFRWPHEAELGLWLGCIVLAFYCVAIGKCIYIFMHKIHGKYYATMHDDMKHYHKVSMNALHAGNKQAYFAANTLAHDTFGKHFFAKASMGMSTLVPVPFALSWLSLRFEGIPLYHIPLTEMSMGYVFVFLNCYIALRILSAKLFS